MRRTRSRSRPHQLRDAEVERFGQFSQDRRRCAAEAALLAELFERQPSLLRVTAQGFAETGIGCHEILVCRQEAELLRM
jgi:hypothetical protein